MTPSPQPDDSLIPRTQFGWQIKLAVTILLLLIAALIIIIIYPITGTSPVWISQLQTNVIYALGQVGPHFLVGLLGGIVGVAEIASTFQTYPREALQTRWAWVLILVNGVAAILALIIVRATTPQMDLVLQIISVGIGFQALIRTRFVLAKRIGESGDEGEVAVNLGWLYDQFQKLARTQIDLELMNNRRTAVTRLVEYYPTLAELYDIAWYTITARATLTAEEEETRKAALEKLLDPKAPENFAKTSIALMILENGGQAYVELLLNQAMSSHSPETKPPASRPEDLVYQLVDNYSVDDLVTLTERLTDDENVRQYVREAAKPQANAPAPNQKATIAHFLVQQVGADAVQETISRPD